jgi:hypothetical protein
MKNIYEMQIFIPLKKYFKHHQYGLNLMLEL